MNDISPELLKKVQESFEQGTAALREDIKNGVKSYEEAYEYAKQAGEILSKSFGVNITTEVLPDGKMYYNIADKVVRPMLEAEYEIASEAAVSAQKFANKAAGIGIKPLQAEFDAEKVQGIIDRVSSQPFDEIKWILNEPVKTFAKNVVDQTLEKNVEFQGKSGLSPKIRRTALGDACEWCHAVAGTYSYPNVPKDVYRRHANCDCVVEYVEGGKYQDVWSKEIYAKSRADRIVKAQALDAESKKKRADIFGKRARFKTGDETADEYAISKDQLRGFRGIAPDKAVPIARKESKLWLGKISDPAKQLIQRYTYNQNDTTPKFFERINSFIRNGYQGEKDYTEQVEIISDALKQSKLKNNYICYRGSDFDPFEGCKVGENCTAHQFLSTSLSNSGTFNGKYSITILASSGTNAAYVEELSAEQFKKQREMLFDKDVVYKVLSRQGNEIIVRTIP